MFSVEPDSKLQNNSGVTKQRYFFHRDPVCVACQTLLYTCWLFHRIV
jgi:hypothetical protein